MLFLTPQLSHPQIHLNLAGHADWRRGQHDVMPSMRRVLFIALCIVILAAAGWAKYAETNDERAYFVRDGHIYRVEMKGRRFPLVHDPVSLLSSSTREATFTLELPRIEGVIEGREIHERYLGRVVINKERMEVDLYYRDDGTRRALSWNDDYTLVPKDTASTR